MTIAHAWFNNNSFIRINFGDDSNYQQWRIRQSIDMSLRVLSLLICFITAFMKIVASGYENYSQFISQQEFFHGIVFGVVSMSIEIAYFGLLMIVYRYYYNFNVWKPFLTMYQCNHKVIFGLFGLAALILCQEL